MTMATRPQQRSNLQPENVDESDHGQGRDGGAADRDEGDGVEDELSDQELEALSNMRTGERDGGADDQAGDRDAGGDDGDADDADANADGVDDDATAAAAADRDQGARDDRGKQQDKPEQRQAPKTINYGRHQRELGKRDTRLKELEGLLTTEREARTRLDERAKMLLDAINARPKAEDQQQQQQVDDDPEPDNGEDPIGWSQWKIRNLEKVITRLDGAQRDQQQRTQEQSEEEREVGEYTTELSAAAQRDPVVGQAFIHLRESRYSELGAIYAGIDVNDPEQCATLSPQQQVKLSKQIQDAFSSEQRMVYRAAKESGRPVGQVILALAKARLFDPTAVRQQEQQRDDDQGQQRDQGQRRQAPAGARRQQAPVAGQQRQQRSVSEEIDNIRDAAGASKSLSDAGGSPGAAVDLVRLNEMDDDEFMDFLSGTSKSKLDRIMGK